MTLRHKSNAMEMVSVNNKSPKQAFDARLVGSHKDSRGVHVAQETYFTKSLSPCKKGEAFSLADVSAVATCITASPAL